MSTRFLEPDPETALVKRMTVADVLALRPQVEKAAAELVEAARKLRALGEKVNCQFREVQQHGYFGDRHRRLAVDVLDRPETAETGLLNFFDVRAWEFLVYMTGATEVMNSESRNEFLQELYNADTCPALTADNVLATLKDIQSRKKDFLVDGVLEVLHKLSWDYKTNVPCTLGKKFIIKGVINAWGSYGEVGCGNLDDLDHIMFHLRGIERAPGSLRWCSRAKANATAEGPHFSVKFYGPKTGTGHVTIKDEFLPIVAEINRIASIRYPCSITSRTSKPKKEKK